MVTPTERLPLPPSAARVAIPTFGLDGGLLPADPNTFVNFLAPKATVPSQRVEEPDNTSRKRVLPTSEPPNDQSQVERMNHLWETRLTEQVSAQNELAQNGASSKTIPRHELPLSRIKRIMKEDSCSDPLVCMPACLPRSRACNPLRARWRKTPPSLCAGDWTLCTGRVRLRCAPPHPFPHYYHHPWLGSGHGLGSEASWRAGPSRTR